MVIANGAVPDALLAGVEAEHLRKGTAGRWSWICQQVQARFGWTPQIIAGGGYRSLARQADIFTARYVKSTTGVGPYGDVRWWNGVRYVRTSAAGPAAVPGTSNHGLGIAVDVVGLLTFTGTQRAQFATVAAQAGFSDTEGRAVGEPWHWVDTADPDVVTVSDVTVTGSTVPTNIPGVLTATAPPQEDFLMALTDDEQRRVLAAADGWNTWAGALKENTDRLPHIHQQVDIIAAGVGNVTNGVVALLGRAPSTVTAADIAAAIPTDIAQAVADELSKRLAQ